MQAAMAFRHYCEEKHTSESIGWHGKLICLEKMRFFQTDVLGTLDGLFQTGRALKMFASRYLFSGWFALSDLVVYTAGMWDTRVTLDPAGTNPECGRTIEVCICICIMYKININK